MENKEIDKETKAFFENLDVINKDRVINAIRTTYIDLIADATPNISIYSVLNAKQTTKEKQELATYYKVIFEEILSVYKRAYKEKENGGRSFDKMNLVLTTNLKEAFINSIILANTKDTDGTKINPKSNLYVDKTALSIDRLLNKKYKGTEPMKSMFNTLYYDYGQALADLTILRIIGQVLGVELISKDNIVDYWTCVTFEDLNDTIDRLLNTFEVDYKENKTYKKSDFYIDLITTKAINHKISILLDANDLNKQYKTIEKRIKAIIFKDASDEPISKQPYLLSTTIRRELTLYYWNRIKKEIRGVAESEGSYEK